MRWAMILAGMLGLASLAWGQSPSPAPTVPSLASSPYYSDSPLFGPFSSGMVMAAPLPIVRSPLATNPTLSPIPPNPVAGMATLTPNQPTVPMAGLPPGPGSSPTPPMGINPTTNPAPAPSEPAPAEPFVDDKAFLVQSGQLWQEYDITSYTARFHPGDAPEQAIRDWIKAETGEDVWQGVSISSFSVSPHRVSVYHGPEVQQQVADLLGRFLAYQPGTFRCRVRVFNVNDPNWRANYAGKLQTAPLRSPGRQAWFLRQGLAEGFAADVQKQGRSLLLVNQELAVANGQPARVRWSKGTGTYTQGMVVDPNHANAPGSYRPVVGQMDEGVSLVFSPLIGLDAATVDVRADLSLIRLTSTREVKLKAAGSPRIEIPEVREAQLAGNFRLPPQNALILSLGLIPTFDERTNLFRRDRRAELVVLLEILPDPSNRVLEPATIAQR